MKDNMHPTMQEAMRLMQRGDLAAATQAIQRGLRGGPWPTEAGAAPIEGEFRVTDEDVAFDTPEPGEPSREVPRHQPDGGFRDHHFTCDAGTLRYKLFVPSSVDAGKRPLLLMLHGCTQSPDEFALGTRMNTLAEVQGYVVAYPEQPQGKNPSKCWNWFRARDQQRGQGEPALLAALARHLVDAHGLDGKRVYAAGLSAGGAMAAVLGSTYPDVFAAIGVHSGLPFGIAHDVPSALAAMKQGTPASAAATRAALGTVPAIVFHGDRDTTVDPCNGAAVIAQSMGKAGSPAAGPDAPRATVEHGSVPGGRRYTRTVFTHPDGSSVAEQWTVHGGGHAWFGGDPQGSYTDRSGPDASAHMLRFFSARARCAVS